MPPDLRGERVAQVVAVQVRRGDDLEVLRPREHLLQRDVRDGVFHKDVVFRDPAPRPAVELHRAVLPLGEAVAPVAEGALGELHDVALVDERDALALLADGKLDGGANEPLGAELADRLDADADARFGFSPKADLGEFLPGTPLAMKSRNLCASGEPPGHSMPA